MSERAEQLQTAVAQSVSVQEGLNGLLSWLDKLVLHPGQVEPTAQAVQDALTQNQVWILKMILKEAKKKKFLKKSLFIIDTQLKRSIFCI